MVWACDEERGVGEAVRVVMRTNVEGRRGRGRPMKRWLVTVESDTRAADARVRDKEDRETSGSLGQGGLTPNSWEKEVKKKKKNETIF